MSNGLPMEECFCPANKYYDRGRYAMESDSAATRGVCLSCLTKALSYFCQNRTDYQVLFVFRIGFSRNGT